MSDVPFVVTKDGRNERAYDIYSRLLQDRIIFVREINDEKADIVVAQLMYLQSLNTDPIKLYINSPGGSVSAGLAIYDVMQHITAPVHTICIGMAASMGAVLLTGGESGHRYVMPNSKVMIHQPLIHGVLHGQATDLEIAAEEMLKARNNLYAILAKHSNKPITQIEADCDRNKWFTAQEAVDYGCADKVVSHG